MTSRIGSRVPPYITVMVCIAGCSSTTSQDLPYSQGLPPPDFNRVPQPSEQRITKQPAAPERPAPKPITVDVPMAVQQGPPPPQIVTTFEPVDPPVAEPAHLSEADAPAKPFFTPLQSAEAIMEPLVRAEPQDMPVQPKPIQYAQYVSVGPEYFGAGSEIAPYVISRADTPRRPNPDVTEPQTVALRPDRVLSESGRYSVTTDVVAPVVYSAPPRDLPRAPAPQDMPAQIAALMPPRGAPQQKRSPIEPAPRDPFRHGPDRLSLPTLRDETLKTEAGAEAPKLWKAEVKRASPLPRLKHAQTPQVAANEAATAAPWLTAVTPTLAPAPTLVDEQPERELYRVTLAPPTQPATRVTSLDPSPTLVEPVFQGPTLQAVKPSIAQATPISPCLVAKGSNARMILVCKGIEVPQSEVFRAVVEGESAFRGLRRFDEPDSIVAAYGFNSARFMAMTLGPRTARDLAFLRSLRKSGKTVRVKGHPFDLYLMKGDHSLATVLVQRVAATETQPAAASAR